MRFSKLAGRGPDSADGTDVRLPLLRNAVSEARPRIIPGATAEDLGDRPFRERESHYGVGWRGGN